MSTDDESTRRIRDLMDEIRLRPAREDDQAQDAARQQALAIEDERAALVAMRAKYAAFIALASKFHVWAQVNRIRPDGRIMGKKRGWVLYEATTTEANCGPHQERDASNPMHVVDRCFIGILASGEIVTESRKRGTSVLACDATYPREVMDLGNFKRLGTPEEALDRLEQRIAELAVSNKKPWP
jgi:hypothetical protein